MDDTLDDKVNEENKENQERDRVFLNENPKRRECITFISGKLLSAIDTMPLKMAKIIEWKINESYSSGIKNIIKEDVIANIAAQLSGYDKYLAETSEAEIKANAENHKMRNEEYNKALKDTKRAVEYLTRLGLIESVYGSKPERIKLAGELEARFESYNNQNGNQNPSKKEEK